MRSTIAVIGLMCLCVAQTASAEDWQLVFSEDFSSPQALARWKLDGVATPSITADGRLLIATQTKEIGGKPARCSVLWYSQPFDGDLRFEFDGKADPKSRCIFFFNARPLKHKSIFDWQRPRADYGNYAWDERIELYTLGMLRSDQERVNLRYLGGPLASYWRQLDTLPRRDPKRKKINREFQEKTIPVDYASPFADAEKTYHFDLRAVGNRLTLLIDGKQMFDLIDKHRAKRPLRGGCFGFRNFKPTRAWYDNVRVYRRKP